MKGDGSLVKDRTRKRTGGARAGMHRRGGRRWMPDTGIGSGVVTAMMDGRSRIVGARPPICRKGRRRSRAAPVPEVLDLDAERPGLVGEVALDAAAGEDDRPDRQGF